MSTNTLFKPWPKIERFKGLTVTLTEKIDGTNGCIIIVDGELVGVQSRNRLITTTSDNFGFANWVDQNKVSIVDLLGDGYHYGEWAGPGIQQNPMKLNVKTFFLFNTFRWDNIDELSGDLPITTVPVLAKNYNLDTNIDDWMDNLLEDRDYQPEGIMIYFHSGRNYLKYTYHGNESKWKLDG